MTPVLLLAFTLVAADPNWIVTWTASSHGPYPAGNPVAQPDLKGILSPATGASDQTFRLIVKPDRWGARIRLRFTNVFGKQPLTIDGVHAGIHKSAGALVPGTNVPVTFRGGARSVTIAPGQLVYSDAVKLPVRKGETRKLAVSFHVAGDSGPMTWHAKAITTSYLSAPKSGSHGAEEGNEAFPHTTTSWFFLDAVEVVAPRGMPVIAAFGDSITDGTGSTINGDDRWPDFLSQRLAGKAVVVNAGIGGNRVVTNAGGGGPSALERMERDLLSLPGVKTVIWMEGINDLGGNAGTTFEQIIAGYREGAARLKKRGIRVIGATLTSAFKSTPTHGTPEVDAQRKALNAFIRNSGGVFDAVIDFDAATVDPATGTLRKEFWPNSGTGGPGDGLHPNRAGYQAMANAIDLRLLLLPN
jgi:lysophospholipase L1-like esterase